MSFLRSTVKEMALKLQSEAYFTKPQRWIEKNRWK